ncbi:uncharacterized protein [Hyperolius riggenbachi]|uniref:uncharacterized protein n=1 Tax=Hyperolius riggenbachi TaxID=752182 RepID=UPI0035A29D6F
MDITDPTTLLLSIALCLFLIIIFYGWKSKTPHNFPPGPTPLPIIGNMHMLDLKKPYKTFHELSKKYGTVYSLQIGEEKIVILSGYETVKDALINHAEEFSGRQIVPLMKNISKGHGVIFSTGENWRVMRRFTLSTLRDFGMGKRTVEDKIQEECGFLVKKIKSFKGQAFDNTMLFNGAVANIIVSILLSNRFDYEDPKSLRLLNVINENIRISGSPTVLLYNAFPSLVKWFPGGHKTALRNAEEMFSFVRETFTNQRKELDANDQRNLIDAFLVKQQEEKPNPDLYFTNDNLTLLVSDLFAAGMETTSTTLRWGILLMMKYPDIQKKVQKEIEKVIGSSEPKPIHRKDMPYTEAVISEIQRFGNIVPTNLPHCTTQDVHFRGYFIPKGTHVLPLLVSVLYDEEHFEKANEFYPEHFLDSSGNYLKKDAFLPFSAGKRSCAGETLAKMELFLFFVSLLQNFTFKAPPGATLDLRGAVGFTRSPKKHKICAVPRFGNKMNITDPTTLLLTVTLCLFLVIVLYGWKKKVPHNFPPGPTPLPIIGNMHILDLKKPYKTFHELSKKYGTVYSLQIGEEKIVILSGYETVKDALVNHAEEFSGRQLTPLMKDVSKGHGLIFSNGENWKVMRRFTLSTLRDFGMGKRTVEDKIQEECGFVVKKIKSLKGQAFDNTMLINAAVANIIISILLSNRFDYEDPKILRLLKIINENVSINGSPTALLYNAFPSLVKWFPGGHKTAVSNAEEMFSFVRETFTNQRKDLDANDQRNLVDAFLVKQQEEKPNPDLYFTNDNLTMLVTDLFVAGMETTSTTLRWGILLMIKYPDVQRKVQKEIERVIGSSQPQAIHRKNMPYTEAVISEIQRFGDIVPTNLPHCTTQDVHFRGHFIPKGTHVLPLLVSVLYDEEHFEKAKEFYPEHFLDSRGNYVKKDAFIPFSSGKRSCAGETLAKMELFLFFVSFLQNFTFKAPPGATLDLSGAVGFTRGPKKHEICAVSRT